MRARAGCPLSKAHPPRSTDTFERPAARRFENAWVEDPPFEPCVLSRRVLGGAMHAGNWLGLRESRSR